MPAQLLLRQELEQIVASNIVVYGPKATDGTKSDSVKNISLDFTIGAIFVPGKKSGELGGVGSPISQIALKQGQTAVIKTAEILKLPLGIGAICFPPSSEVSLRGLLTTNPGVIDPGFQGPLHLTLINMGAADFPLKSGARILRVLLFKDSQVTGSSNPPSKDPITDEILQGLSHDFLDIEKRAQAAARKEVQSAELKLKVATFLVPVITAIIAGCVAYFSAFSHLSDRMADDKYELSNKVDNVRNDLTSLTAKVDGSNSIASLNDRVGKLETLVAHRSSK